MRLSTRSLLFGALMVGFLCADAGLAAADTQQCLAASEKGQKLRSQGKLREARESFVVCGAESCPSIVRHDCSQWNSELAATLPTVVFGAKDKAGKDLFDVKITMDDVPLASKLDGKGVIVDPGKHVFKFEATGLAGLPPVTETDLIKEGEKARAINVVFDGFSDPKDANKAPPGSTTPPPTPVPGAEHSVAPWILVGVGGAAIVAGVIVFALAPDHPSNCDEATQRCTKNPPNESEEDLAKDKQQAGQADSQPILGIVVAGVGAAFVAGGLIWHFLEPVGPAKAGFMNGKLAPWTTGKSSGIGYTGTF